MPQCRRVEVRERRLIEGGARTIVPPIAPAPPVTTATRAPSVDIGSGTVGSGPKNRFHVEGEDHLVAQQYRGRG
jgi:hypothetical protein